MEEDGAEKITQTFFVIFLGHVITSLNMWAVCPLAKNTGLNCGGLNRSVFM